MGGFHTVVVQYVCLYSYLHAAQRAVHKAGSYLTRKHFKPAAYETDLRAQRVSSCMSEYVFRTYYCEVILDAKSAIRPQTIGTRNFWEKLEKE